MKNKRNTEYPLKQSFAWWIDWVETDLQLDTSKIAYRWCPTLGSRGKSTNPLEWGSQHVVRRHVILVRPNLNYRNQYRLTLAHELRHVWQIQNGYLSWDNEHPFIWCGVKLPPRMLYSARPHEVDARAYAAHMVYGSSRPVCPTVTQAYRDKYAQH